MSIVFVRKGTANSKHVSLSDKSITYCVEEIHSVGTINNVETYYFTQLKMLPNDNVSMSVGHLDHVLIVYSSMEHVTWKSPGPMCG